MDCASRDVQGRCHFRSFEPVCRSQRRAIIRVRFVDGMRFAKGKKVPGRPAREDDGGTSEDDGFT
jgi:hypothetical protein